MLLERKTPIFAILKPLLRGKIKQTVLWRKHLMKIYYGSAAYFAYIAAALIFCAAIYIILREKEKKTQKFVILGIMLLNVTQHLLKSFIYPGYEGLGFSAFNTAYNMCAALILVSPIALLFNVRLLRDFVYYAGSFAGIIAIVIPYWHIGADALDPEAVRSFICHALLFSTSLLPLLLGLHKPSYKCFYKLGLCFILFLCVIILNDAICIAAGIYPGLEGMPIPDALYLANPVWAFGPPESFSFALNIAKVFSPDAWVGDNPGGRCLPILWYAVPTYLFITAVAFFVCTAVDRKKFVSDVKNIHKNGNCKKIKFK